MTPRVALFGTFHPAVPTFAALAARGWVAVLVVPDRAGWKNDELLTLADRFGVPWTAEPASLDPASIDLVLAANYPDLIGPQFLGAVPCVNTHWSLLPRHRGVHPTAWALLNGDEEAGVTVHLMAAEFDTGDVLRQGASPIDADEPIVELHRRLADLQAELVVDVVEHLADHGVLPPATPQDETQATYVPQRFPSDGLIDWNWTSERLAALVHALPRPLYPGAFTHTDGRRLVIWSARPAPTPPYHATPGRVVRVLEDAVWIKTGDTALEVSEVQWADEDEPVPAAGALRQGQRLGLRPELEIVQLREELADTRTAFASLQAEVADLRTELASHRAAAVEELT